MASHPPVEVVVHNRNEWILNKYGLYHFIQIQHYGDENGQDDDTKDTLILC